MPMLDVSFVLDQAEFEDEFKVRRRLDVVGKNGRVIASPDEWFDAYGVVTQQDPAELLKTEDGQSIMSRKIFLASRTRFVQAAEGQQGDEITWNGIIYTCISSLPYSRYGEGFYEAIAEFREPIPPSAQ